jgi:hypothetical protein
MVVATLRALVARLRIFLSFHSKDQVLAEALREGLQRLEPAADIFLSSVSLGAGFWLGLRRLNSTIASMSSFDGPFGPGRR